MTNFYLNKNNSTFNIRKSNNNFYLLQITDGSEITGLVLEVDAANASSYDGSGTTWYDLAAPSNDLTLANSGQYQTVGTVKAMYLNGTLSSDIITDNSYNDYLNFGTNPFSIELWARYTDSSNPYGDILNIGTYANGVLLRRSKSVTPNIDSLYIGGVHYDWLSSTNMPQDTWKHIVVVKSGTNVKLYADTALIVDGSGAPSSVTPSTGILMGKAAHYVGGFDENFIGYVSSLKIYNGYALSATQIAQKFNDTSSYFGFSPTPTPTTTVTPSITPTLTRTLTPTPSITPTLTPTRTSIPESYASITGLTLVADNFLKLDGSSQPTGYIGFYPDIATMNFYYDSLYTWSNTDFTFYRSDLGSGVGPLTTLEYNIPQDVWYIQSEFSAGMKYLYYSKNIFDTNDNPPLSGWKIADLDAGTTSSSPAKPSVQGTNPSTSLSFSVGDLVVLRLYGPDYPGDPNTYIHYYASVNYYNS